jgi:hypothetical protein
MVNNDTPRFVVRIIANNIINENIFILLVENYSLLLILHVFYCAKFVI